MTDHFDSPPPLTRDLPPGLAPRASTLPATLAYMAYLVTFVTGIGWLVGVILAYVNRGSGSAWIDTHYTYLIRTFWIGLLYTLVGFALVFVLVGWLVWAAAAVWLILRCARGLSWLGHGEPVPDPKTWWV